MAFDTYMVLAATYDSTEEAVADFHAVHDVYKESGLIDTYDAAVVSRGDDGKVRIVEKHEQPTRQGAWGGLGIGLVGGALVALFPAIGIGAGLLAGGAGGAGLGALAGHVAAGMSRNDLKELGELLDEGHSGLVVIAASDMERRVEESMARAERLEKRQVRADPKLLATEIDEAYGPLHL
jgi:uncharacterized membrane protein